MSFFRNRTEAGRELARHVQAHKPEPNVLIVGLPRGGVAVAAEVALVLNTELDILLVRKLGLPGEEELAFGAIASGNVRVLNQDIMSHYSLSRQIVEQVTERERAELNRRERLYREGRPPIPVQGRSIVLIDDGLATGASMLAATRALWTQGVREITVAVPVASKQTCEEFRREVNHLICAATPNRFGAVGKWYSDFRQVGDEEVRLLLEQAAYRSHAVRSAV